MSTVIGTFNTTANSTVYYKLISTSNANLDTSIKSVTADNTGAVSISNLICGQYYLIGCDASNEAGYTVYVPKTATGTITLTVGGDPASTGGTGASGYSGYSGATGGGGSGTGTSGYSGFSGATGSNGTNGTQGTSGYSGVSGARGTSGYSGAGVNAANYAALSGANFTGNVAAPKFAGSVLVAGGGGSVPALSRGMLDTTTAGGLSANSPWSFTPMTFNYIASPGPGQISNGATYTANLWSYKMYGGLPVFCQSPYTFTGTDHGGSADYVDSVTLTWDNQSSQVDGFIIVLVSSNWYVTAGNYYVLDKYSTTASIQVKDSSWAGGQAWIYDAGAVSGAIFNGSPSCSTFIDFAGNLNIGGANFNTTLLTASTLSAYGMTPTPTPNPLNGVFGWNLNAGMSDTNYITSFYFSLAGTNRLTIDSTGATVIGTFKSTNVDTETAPTAISGHSGCTYQQPFSGTYYKKVVIYLNAYTGTAVGVTYPHAFTKTPSVVKNDTTCTLPSLTNSGCTITGTSQTGFIILEGY